MWNCGTLRFVQMDIAHEKRRSYTLTSHTHRYFNFMVSSFIGVRCIMSYREEYLWRRKGVKCVGDFNEIAWHLRAVRAKCALKRFKDDWMTDSGMEAI